MPVIGPTDAIFDTGTTLIVGDPAGIELFYAPLTAYGAMPAPQYGTGIYTSKWVSSVADQTPYNVFFLSQSLATSTFPSPFMLEGRKSRFPPKHLTLAPYPKVLIPALLEQPRVRHSRVVSWPLMTFSGDNAETGTDFWILGDVFLRNVYTAWDVGTGQGDAQIGFADLA